MIKSLSRSWISIKTLKNDTKVKRTMTNLQTRPKPIGGKRGEVKELTSASMRRMKLHARNMPHASYIITLTYPSNYPSDGAKVKHHFRVMRQWFKMLGVSAFWFLEFQERGAPHFHLFTDNPVMKDELSAKWYKVVGSNDIKHFKAGTQIQRIKKPHAIAAYAAKYAVKQDQKEVPAGYTNVGRFWGAWGIYRRVESETLYGENMHDSKKLEVDQNAQALLSAIRSAKKLLKARGFEVKDKGMYGFTMWGIGASIMVRLAEYYGYNNLIV